MPRQTDKDLHTLAAGAMLMHAARVPLSTVTRRIVWRSDMRLFVMQQGADKPTADLVNELLFWHRFKGMTIPDSLKRARAELRRRKRREQAFKRKPARVVSAGRAS